MARVELVKPDKIDDPVVQAIFAWVTQMESAVPNHFYRGAGDAPGDNRRGLR